MFSSLASLLPSLHINTSQDLPKQTVNPEETIKEDQENAYDVQTIQASSDQDPAKEKEKDVKSPSEVCHLFSGSSSQSGAMDTRIVDIMYVSRYLTPFIRHLTPVKGNVFLLLL